MSKFAVGQRVRVTYEGVVSSYAPWSAESDLRVESGGNIYALYPEMENRTIELVEPEYVEGEPYRDENGEVWIYWASTIKGRAWTCTGSTGLHEFDAPLRPLVHLVAEAEV